MTKKPRKQYQSAIYRLNISYLHEKMYGKFPILGKATQRPAGISPELDHLKRQVLQLIWTNEKRRGLQFYTVAWQTHQSNGLAHLDILLSYEKAIKRGPLSFNYIFPLCVQDVTLLPDYKPRVNITPYAASRLNQAILEYGQKEDPQPLTNFTPQNSSRFLVLAQLKKDPYGYLSDVMKKDPFNFDLSSYVQKYNLDKNIPSWNAIKSKLNDIQAAARTAQQHRKPGIRRITRQLIVERLTPEELKVYDTHSCFQVIVDHLNQIPRYGPERPHKTLNLYIYGPHGIGKTSFINEGPTNLSMLVPHYDINIQHKYLNRYFNGVYGFISWNEFKYTDFSPTWVLKLLEGLDLQIPIRYSSNVKRDNPLIIATSNLSLRQHIRRRFEGDSHLIELANSNLIGQRITEVEVPVNMIFMQKLLVPALPPEKPFD